MTELIKPENEDAVLDAVSRAYETETKMEIVGAGTKRAYGRPVSEAPMCLDLSGLRGITLYEPNELVLRAGAGTPLAEVSRALDEADQMLAFEPQDLSSLFGTTPGGGTIGGLIAAGLSGPRRIKDGASRDHLLGFRAVSGRAEMFKSGGRVVKNVTGFDLSKLMAGSFGTLAVMTEVTLKVVPRPEKARTVLVSTRDPGAAAAVMHGALGSPYDVSAAAYLPAPAAARSEVGYVSGAGAVTAVRVEGFGPSVEARCASLREMLSGFGEVEELHSQNSAALWREIRDVRLLPVVPEGALWRVSLPPTMGIIAAARIKKTIDGAEVFLDWGGGLLWVSVPPASDGFEGTIRSLVAEAGSGHATLVFAPPSVREAASVFQPGMGGVSVLERRIKETFDPKAILNPGRMAVVD